MGAASLLALPVGEGAARYLRHVCKQADAACIRLANPADIEALHDFRVAIRRARSWLRAYHLYLPLDKALQKRLRDLARHTNAARDAEVSMAGLQALAGRGGGAQKADLHGMLARLEQERQQAYADILHHIPSTWPGLGRDLKHRLRRHKVAASPAFSHVALELAAAAEAELAQRLRAIGGERDIDAMHQARIAAKRLRYLLEPFKGEMLAVREAVQGLTGLQDALGAIHDGYVLQQRLAASTEETASMQIRHLLALTLADPGQVQPAVERAHAEQAGLLAWVGLTVEQQHRRFAEFRSRYLGRQLGPFLRQLERSIAHLSD